MTTPSPNKSGDASALWKISGMGIELAGSIIGMVLLGWGLDHWLGTSPRWTLIGAGVGMLGGGYNFIRVALRLSKQNAADYRRSHQRAAQPADSPQTEPEATSETIRQRLSDFERDLKRDLEQSRRDRESDAARREEEHRGTP